MASKRKHIEVSLQKKYEALQELEKGKPCKEVSKRFEVPPSTLSTWRKNKDKIYEAFQSSSLKRQRIKVGTFEKVNQALLKWFMSM